MDAPQQPATAPTASAPPQDQGGPVGECAIIADADMCVFFGDSGFTDNVVAQIRGSTIFSISRQPMLGALREFHLLWLESTLEGHVALEFLAPHTVPVIFISKGHLSSDMNCPRTLLGIHKQPTTISSMLGVAAVDNELTISQPNDLDATDFPHMHLLYAAAGRPWVVIVVSEAVSKADRFYRFIVSVASTLATVEFHATRWAIDYGLQSLPAEVCALPFVNDLLSRFPPTNRTITAEQRAPLCFVISSCPALYWMALMLHLGYWFRDGPFHHDIINVLVVRHASDLDVERQLLFSTRPFMLNFTLSCCVCGADLDVPMMCFNCNPKTKALTVPMQQLGKFPSVLAFAARSGDHVVVIDCLTNILFDQSLSTDAKMSALRVAVRNAVLGNKEAEGAELARAILSTWSTDELGPVDADIVQEVNCVAPDLPEGQMVPSTEVAEDIFDHLQGEGELEAENAQPQTLPTLLVDGKLRLVRDLIKDPCTINKSCDEKGNTPLHLSVIKGDVIALRMVLEAGAKLSMENKDRNTPLACAVQAGESACVSQLIAAGADVNLVNHDGTTALLNACTRGFVACVSVLLAAGANVNVTDGNTSSPMMVAALYGRASVVQLLLDAGLSPDSPSDLRTHMAPLHLAARNGHAEVARVLLAAGANVHIESTYGTPIIIACNFGRAAVAEQLIRAGASIDDPYDGQVPLHRACVHNKPDVAEVLLRAGAKLNQVMVKNGCTEVHYACRRGGACLPMLLAAGSDPHALTKSGQSALHLSCITGNLEALQALLNTGIDPDHGVIGAPTPLHLAVQFKHDAVVKLLLSYGANHNAVTEPERNTPLHLAAGLRATDITVMLLAAGAEPDFPNCRGEVPLHLIDNSYCYRLLIKAGADASRRDHKGRLPAECATFDLARNELQIAAKQAKYSHPRKIR